MFRKFFESRKKYACFGVRSGFLLSEKMNQRICIKCFLNNGNVDCMSKTRAYEWQKRFKKAMKTLKLATTLNVLEHQQLMTTSKK